MDVPSSLDWSDVTGPGFKSDPFNAFVATRRNTGQGPASPAWPPVAQQRPMTVTNKDDPAMPHELLTPDNCVVALIDHQPQMLFGVANFDRQGIINNTVGLAKAARLFGVPTILSTVETTGFSGYMWPQLRAVFPDAPLYERTSMNAWEDAPFRAAVEATGRRKIVLAGLWTQVCVAFPTIQAIAGGYEVYVVEDACGDISEVAHRAAMQRVVQAGAVPMTWIQTMLEWQRDWARTATYGGVVDIVTAHGGAYGVGIEYARTMLPAAVH